MISALSLFFHSITSFFRLEIDVFTCLYSAPHGVGA